MDEREAMEGSGLVEVENRLRPQDLAPGVRNALNYLRFLGLSVVPSLLGRNRFIHRQSLGG